MAIEKTQVGRIPLGIRTSGVLRRRLEIQAGRCEMPMSDFCRRLLDAGVSRLEAKQETHDESGEALLNRAKTFEATLCTLAELHKGGAT